MIIISTPYIKTKWYIGEKAPEDPRFYESNFLRIQADGDELDHIKYIFPNLTIFSTSKQQKVVIWYGDIAKTILANL